MCAESRSNVTLLCAWLYGISGFRLVDADLVLTGKDESTDVVEEVFLKHFVSRHLCDEFQESPSNLYARRVVLVLENGLLLPLQFSESGEHVALQVELLVAQHVGHDGAGGGETDLLVPVKVLFELLQAVSLQAGLQLRVEVGRKIGVVFVQNVLQL